MMQNISKAQAQVVETRTESSQHGDPKTAVDEKAAIILKKLDLVRSNPNNIDDAYLVPLLVELLDVFGEKEALSCATTIKIPEVKPQQVNNPPQTTENGIPKPPNQRKGDWTCPNQKCLNINFAKRDRCNKCGIQKPLEFKRQDEERMRNAPVFKPGDWYCPRCNNLNFAKRTNCTRCNLPHIK